MKKIILCALVISSSAFAAQFQGTMVLKGSLKSKVTVNGVETTCRASVDKVKNILEEDSNGNPGYRLRLAVKLDGRDEKRKIEVKVDQTATVNNFFKVGDKVEARDLEYADSETNSGLTMKIDYEGRIKSVSVPFQGQSVTCLF